MPSTTRTQVSDDLTSSRTDRRMQGELGHAGRTVTAVRVPCAIRMDPRGRRGVLETLGETVSVGPGEVSVVSPIGLRRGNPIEITFQLGDTCPTVIEGLVSRSRRISSGTFEIEVHGQVSSSAG